MAEKSDLTENKNNIDNTENSDNLSGVSDVSGSCGKGVKVSENGEFLTMNLGAYDRERKEEAEIAERSEDFGALLDEPVDAEIPEELEVDPQLAAEWEKRLAESFKNDPISPHYDEPPLHAVRKCRPHKKH